MMEKAFGDIEVSNNIELAVENVLLKGRTPDIMPFDPSPNLKQVNTEKMGDMIREVLKLQFQK